MGGNNRNKTELVEAMAAKAGTSKKDTEAVLNACIETVSDELQAKGKVQLVGFDTFETSERAARTGRNPQTGATTKIAACTAPKFKAGKALKDKVNTKAKKSKK
jgi:DNA-binding protein HU-beta